MYLRKATLDALVFEHRDAVFQHSGCVPVLGLMSRGHGDSGAELCLLHLLLTIRAHSAQKRRQMQTSSRVGVCLWKVRGMHRVAPLMREALICGTMHHRSSAVASLLEDRTVCAVTQASSSSEREPALIYISSSMCASAAVLTTSASRLWRRWLWTQAWRRSLFRKSRWPWFYSKCLWRYGSPCIPTE